MPLKSMLMPSSVPITQAVLDGQVLADHGGEDQRHDAVEAAASPHPVDERKCQPRAELQPTFRNR